MRRAWTWTRRAGCRRPGSCCRPAAASGTAGSPSMPASREYLLRHLPDIPDALTRGSATVTLWEDMLDGRARAAGVVDMLVTALPRERDELNVQRMLSYTQQGYWRFLSDRRARRADAAARADPERRARARRHPEPEVGVVLGAARHGADARRRCSGSSGSGGRTETVPGLVLAEPDFVALAQELAVRGVPAWQEILDLQLERTENPDRKARFAFVRPVAVSRPARPRRVLREPGRRDSAAAASRGCSKGCPTSITRCERRRRGSTFPAASRCCARSSGRATSSFRSDGWTRRSRGIAPRAPRRWSGRSSRPFHRTTPTGSGGSSCRRPTIYSERRARRPSCGCCDASRTRCRPHR